MKRYIALVDCDSFFVSCEQAENPDLLGKPVCVLSNNGGCVVSRSKEAKQVGVKMGEPYFLAKKAYPDVIYIYGDLQKYSKFSKKVMSCLKNFSSDVEQYSIDEAFIDITGTKKLYKKNYVEIAKMIREKIFEETQIPVSIGLSVSKTLAKLASDKAKDTGGLYVIGSAKINKILKETDIDDVWGIGKNLQTFFKRWGIYKCNGIINSSDEWLKKNLGIVAVRMKHELMGEVVSPVSNEVKLPKSIQNTSALKSFTTDKTILKQELSKHIHKSCVKIRKNGGTASIIGMMLRTKDFQVFYRKRQLDYPTNFEIEVSNNVMAMLDEIYQEGTIYRSTGVMLENIVYSDSRQQSFFEDEKLVKNRNLAKAIDKIEDKFGSNTIRIGY